jgi:hypothetical protein
MPPPLVFSVVLQTIHCFGFQSQKDGQHQLNLREAVETVWMRTASCLRLRYHLDVKVLVEYAEDLMMWEL